MESPDFVDSAVQPHGIACDAVAENATLPTSRPAAPASGASDVMSREQPTMLLYAVVGLVVALTAWLFASL